MGHFQRLATAMSRLPVLLLIALLGACAQQEPRPEPVPQVATPRIGVVGLVQEQRKREINTNNWQQVIGGVIRNSEKDMHVNVVSTRYEVTVFFEAGESATVVVDKDPGVQPGQRVRVIGNTIEPLGR